MNLDGSPHDAWRTCYRQTAAKLLLFARQWVPSLADAEDVLQMAFVRFWHARPDAQPQHYPLLYAAVRSAALDFRRGQERRSRREEAFHAESLAIPFFEPALERREEAAAVQQALATLPAEQREVLILRIWGGLTFAEIASVLCESINTVASRHRYALQALRPQLEPLHHE